MTSTLIFFGFLVAFLCGYARGYYKGCRRSLVVRPQINLYAHEWEREPPSPDRDTDLDELNRMYHGGSDSKK